MDERDKNTGERKLLVNEKKNTEMKCCDLRYVVPLENHLAKIAAPSTLKC